MKRTGPKLEIVHGTISSAKAYVKQHHRHHKPPAGGLFALAVAEEGRICGIAIVGRPVSRHIASAGVIAEVTRCCTDGTANACSALYAASWRAARSLGYQALITYTLQEESGGSLIAAGWRLIGETKGGAWSRVSRPREDLAPLGVKKKWSA